MTATTTLNTLVAENGTMKAIVAFTDDASAAVTPTAATWTLSDNEGNVINSRDAVAIGSLSSSVTIVLSGADLAISTYGKKRVLTVEWTYDSDAGSNLPGKAELHFTLEDLVNVP